MNKLKEECGIFGIFGHQEAARLTYLGLFALQHRGQESAGIVCSSGGELISVRGMGHVNEVFSEEKLTGLTGENASGHVRYSTSGESRIANAQPILISSFRGQLSLCHNGNLVNASEIRKQLEKEGSIFQSSSDSEVILHLIAKSNQRVIEDAIVDALNAVKGAYSLVFQTENSLIGIRDPLGFRPLILGKLDESYIFASETTALDLVYGEFIREIEPGEMVVADKQGLRSIYPFEKQDMHQCIFELVYFARPDSYIFGQYVNDARNRMGRIMARESPVEADIVVPVPDSGTCAAIGYSAESGIPFDMPLIRNHYVGRTFIEPKQSIRNFGVKIKLNPVKSAIKDKRVILIDDSVVRGTTSRKIVSMVREAGAREVHMRLSSPPYVSPCYYGIDTPYKSELIAATHTVEEIRKHIRADSLAYISRKGLLDAVRQDGQGFCTSCFTGEYPLNFPESNELQQSLFIKGR